MDEKAIEIEEVWEVFVNGGRVNTGVDVMEWVERAEGWGAGEIVLNVMNADGTKAGYDCEMTAAVSEAVGVPVVASGGAGSPEDMLRVLQEGKADAALAASIFHFREYSVGEVKWYLAERGVCVREGSGRWQLNTKDTKVTKYHEECLRRWEWVADGGGFFGI